MIVLCIGLLDCINTFLQPIIHPHAFGSVLLLKYASACFCPFEKSAATYAHTSTIVALEDMCNLHASRSVGTEPLSFRIFCRIQSSVKNVTVCLRYHSEKHFDNVQTV